MYFYNIELFLKKERKATLGPLTTEEFYKDVEIFVEEKCKENESYEIEKIHNGPRMELHFQNVEKLNEMRELLRNFILDYKKPLFEI